MKVLGSDYGRLLVAETRVVVCNYQKREHQKLKVPRLDQKSLRKRTPIAVQDVMRDKTSIKRKKGMT